MVKSQKLRAGTTMSSHARHIALAAGIPRSIVERGEEVRANEFPGHGYSIGDYWGEQRKVIYTLADLLSILIASYPLKRYPSL